MAGGQPSLSSLCRHRNTDLDLATHTRPSSTQHAGPGVYPRLQPLRAWGRDKFKASLGNLNRQTHLNIKNTKGWRVELKGRAHLRLPPKAGTHNTHNGKTTESCSGCHLRSSSGSNLKDRKGVVISQTPENRAPCDTRQPLSPPSAPLCHPAPFPPPGKRVQLLPAGVSAFPVLPQPRWAGGVTHPLSYKTSQGPPFLSVTLRAL